MICLKHLPGFQPETWLGGVPGSSVRRFRIADYRAGTGFGLGGSMPAGIRRRCWQAVTTVYADD